MTDSEMLAVIRALLPDTYSESKDWRTGNVTERIICLKAWLESKTEEVDRLIDILNDNRISAQAAEIERLRGEVAKAQGALHQIAGKKDYADDPWDIARTTLAELTGAQKDGS